MKFNDILNQYIEEIGCTAKELSEASGLSAATLSRYCAGKRMPDSEQMNKIITGIVCLAENRQIPDMNIDSVCSAFGDFLEGSNFDYDQFISNFNALISTLDINLSELSRSLNFDSSYLSHIRLGQRHPSDPEGLIDGICQYVIRKKFQSGEQAAIAELIGCQKDEIASESSCFTALSSFLKNGVTETHNYLGDFLNKLDEFDLDQYIRAIHFDELKVPSMPFQLPTSRHYYGIDGMKQGELDFFKSTVLSKSMEPVFMCSDMAMEDMAEDLDFGKKWMFAIAMTLKKGLHLNIIHNIDRPFKEMMLGLESWIPIYMTGQVSPYYLKGTHNRLYCHINYVSGHTALTGECIQGFHEEGKYYVTRNKKEVAYYQKKAARLLAKAHPLMEIYRQDSKKNFYAFLTADARTDGIRHNILSSLPIYTMPQDLLLSILKRNSISDSDAKQILDFAKTQRTLAETMMQNGSIFDEIPSLSQEEFEKHPMSLSLSGKFYEKEVYYTYEEYTEHLNATKLFAQTHPNYSLKIDPVHVFRNIQIQIHEGKWVMVSKNKAPAIHFVIRHSKMLNAFENFIVPVVE